MSVSATSAAAYRAEGRRGTVHVLSLALVWLTFATSSLVLVEPAPHDVLMLGLIFLLPLVRLANPTPPLVLYLGAWLLIAAGGFVASAKAVHVDVATTHTVVTLYLSLASVVLAAFVATRPERHARLVFSGLAVAAVIATLAGIVGYFGLVPGARELFTVHARASGTFKDPNVLGAFLVPVLIYAVHTWLVGGAGQTLASGGLFALILFGLFLTFSRGAWFNAGVALIVYAYLALVTSPTDWRRLKLVVLALLGAGVGLAVVAAALQFPQVAGLFEDRASLSHDYDIGPQGRFGGHRLAFDLLLRHPLGLGALEFGAFHHQEDVHNVYLSMFLNAGWVGGLAYFCLTAGTLAAGLRYALRRSAAQGALIVAVASLAGHAVTGLVVDTDHWRHSYVLLGLVWGLIAASPRLASPPDVRSIYWHRRPVR